MLPRSKPSPGKTIRMGRSWFFAKFPRLTPGGLVAYDYPFAALQQVVFIELGRFTSVRHWVDCHGCPETQTFQRPHQQSPGASCLEAAKVGVLPPVQHRGALASDLPQLRPLHGPRDRRNGRRVSDPCVGVSRPRARNGRSPGGPSPSAGPSVGRPDTVTCLGLNKSGMSR